MTNTNEQIDPLLDEFRSEEEAAEFWDKHSIADYDASFSPVDFEADIKRRYFEIEVDEESFVALLSSVKKQHKPVKELASEILRQKLTPV